jgi:hypothetical protein
VIDPTTQKFWVLRQPGNQRPLMRAAYPEFEETPCPATDRHSARRRRTGSLHVIANPSVTRDFNWTWQHDMLITPRTLAVFEKHQVTRFEVRPVNVQYPTPIKARPPELYEVVITGWGGLPSREAGLTVIESCPSCGHRNYEIAKPGLVINPGAWDGSDLFMVWPLPRFPFANDRLAKIIRGEKLSGVKLVPAPAIPLNPGDDFDPGSLFQWMPEQRAQELSRRFDLC